MLYSFWPAGRSFISETARLLNRIAMAEESASKTAKAPSDKAEEKAEEPDPNLLATLADGTKLKRRIPRQRACNNPGKNNNICRGHLKRWYEFGDEVSSRLEAGDEVYRCERCQALYLPNQEEVARTGTLSF